MSRITLLQVIPVLLVLGGLGLFMHSWTTGPAPAPPPPNTAAWRAAMHPDSLIGVPAAPAPASSTPPAAVPDAPPAE